MGEKNGIQPQNCKAVKTIFLVDPLVRPVAESFPWHVLNRPSEQLCGSPMAYRLGRIVLKTQLGRRAQISVSEARASASCHVGTSYDQFFEFAEVLRCCGEVEFVFRSVRAA